MRVVVLTPFYRPSVGGSSQLLDDIAQHLHHNGHTVTVLTYSFDIQAEAGFDPYQPFPIERIKAKGFKGAGSVQSVFTLLGFCRRFRPDVVFCGAAFPTALIAMFAKLLLGMPFVVYTHGEDVFFRPDQGLAKKICGWTMAKAAALVANSSFSASQMQEQLPRPKPVEVIHPWIDPEPLMSMPPERVEEVRKAAGLEGRRVLLTVARLELRKGHDRIVEALPLIAEKVSDVTYLIIGKGSPDRIMGIAKNLGVEDRVRVLEYVPQDDLPAYYKLADAYVMTPRRDPRTGLVEGFGMVFVEAAAAGRPSIAGSQGGCRDAVVAGETGLIVDPEDPKAIAAAAIELLQDSAKGDVMGVRGQLRAKACFSAAGQLARLQDVIEAAAVRG